MFIFTVKTVICQKQKPFNKIIDRLANQFIRIIFKDNRASSCLIVKLEFIRNTFSCFYCTAFHLGICFWNFLLVIFSFKICKYLRNSPSTRHFNRINAFLFVLSLRRTRLVRSFSPVFGYFKAASVFGCIVCRVARTDFLLSNGEWSWS